MLLRVSAPLLVLGVLLLPQAESKHQTDALVERPSYQFPRVLEDKAKHHADIGAVEATTGLRRSLFLRSERLAVVAATLSLAAALFLMWQCFVILTFESGFFTPGVRLRALAGRQGVPCGHMRGLATSGERDDTGDALLRSLHPPKSDVEILSHGEEFRLKSARVQVMQLLKRLQNAKAQLLPRSSSAQQHNGTLTTAEAQALVVEGQQKFLKWENTLDLPPLELLAMARCYSDGRFISPTGITALAVAELIIEGGRKFPNYYTQDEKRLVFNLVGIELDEMKKHRRQLPEDGPPSSSWIDEAQRLVELVKATQQRMTSVGLGPHAAMLEPERVRLIQAGREALKKGSSVVSIEEQQAFIQLPRKRSESPSPAVARHKETAFISAPARQPPRPHSSMRRRQPSDPNLKGEEGRKLWQQVQAESAPENAAPAEAPQRILPSPQFTRRPTRPPTRPLPPLHEAYRAVGDAEADEPLGQRQVAREVESPSVFQMQRSAAGGLGAPAPGRAPAEGTPVSSRSRVSPKSVEEVRQNFDDAVKEFEAVYEMLSTLPVTDEPLSPQSLPMSPASDRGALPKKPPRKPPRRSLLGVKVSPEHSIVFSGDVASPIITAPVPVQSPTTATVSWATPAAVPITSYAVAAPAAAAVAAAPVAAAPVAAAPAAAAPVAAAPVAAAPVAAAPVAAAPVAAARAAPDVPWRPLASWVEELGAFAGEPSTPVTAPELRNKYASWKAQTWRLTKRLQENFAQAVPDTVEHMLRGIELLQSTEALDSSTPKEDLQDCLAEAAECREVLKRLGKILSHSWQKTAAYQISRMETSIHELLARVSCVRGPALQEAWKEVAELMKNSQELLKDSAEFLKFMHPIADYGFQSREVTEVLLKFRKASKWTQTNLLLIANKTASLWLKMLQDMSAQSKSHPKDATKEELSSAVLQAQAALVHLGQVSKAVTSLVFS